MVMRVKRRQGRFVNGYTATNSAISHKKKESADFSIFTKRPCAPCKADTPGVIRQELLFLISKTPLLHEAAWRRILDRSVWQVSTRLHKTGFVAPVHFHQFHLSIPRALLNEKSGKNRCTWIGRGVVAKKGHLIGATT